MTLNVLITGANSGFGFLTTRTFARAGHTVHAGYRNPEKIARLKELAADGHHVHPVKLDVTDPADIAAAVASALVRAPIDVLVNNAGFAVSAPVEVLSDDSLLTWSPILPTAPARRTSRSRSASPRPWPPCGSGRSRTRRRSPTSSSPASTHPDPKLRYVSGADAKMMVPLYRLQSFEAWAAAMLGQLGLGDVITPPTA